MTCLAPFGLVITIAALKVPFKVDFFYDAPIKWECTECCTDKNSLLSMA